MKILTDCAADLPKEDIQAYGITVAPLYINFPEEQISSNDIGADEFYTRLKAMAPNAPTTSQPSPGVFSEIYKKLAEVGEEIISIHVSSGLSGTFNSACQGAKQAVGAVVHMVDSMTLSGGERFQVLAAARALKAGWERERIIERLAKLRAATEVIYTLDTLAYLARGGRIGRVQALAGALLGLKPVIRVDQADGKYSPTGKARTIGKAVQMVADHLAEKYAGTSVWATVLHGQFVEQAENLAGLLRERMDIGKLEVLRISPVLGVHTGPGVVGAAVAPLELVDILD